MPVRIPGVPTVQHLPRHIFPTEIATYGSLKRLSRSSPPFSYNPSRMAARKMLSGNLPLSALLTLADRQRSDLGKKCNREVLIALHEYVQRKRRDFQTFDVPTERYTVRGPEFELHIPVRPAFAFVEDGKPRIFWLQPWRDRAYTERQLAIFGAILRQTCLVGDFVNADFEIVDLSAPGSDSPREFSILRNADLPDISHDELRDALGTFATAYDRLKKEIEGGGE